MKNSVTVKNLSELPAAAERFADIARSRRILALDAPMGAGKTTFTSALCKALGVEGDVVNSPTFSIVNEYVTKDGESIFHFDFYRLKNKAEVLDIGYYDYIDSGCICIMEWPEIIGDLLPEDALTLHISVQNDQSRIIEWE